MGFLGKSSTTEQRIKDFLKKNNIRLDNSTLEDLISRFPNEDLFFEVANTFYSNDLTITENDFVKIISSLSNFYEYILDERLYLSIVKILSEYPAIIDTKILPKIMFAFSDKKIVQEVLIFIFNMYRNKDNKIEINNLDNLEEALSYLIVARRYYVDDRAILTSFIDFIITLGINELKYGNKETINDVAANFIAEDKRANGIYNISHEELEFLRQVEEMLGIKSEQLKTLLGFADKNISQTKRVYEELRLSATEYAKRQMQALESKSSESLNQFEAKYAELVRAQKDGLLEDKDILIASLESVLGEKKTELLSFISTTKTDYENDLSRLRKEQKGILSGIDSYIENNKKLSELIQSSQSDKDFLNKMDLVEQLAKELQEKLPIISSNMSSNQASTAPSTTASITTQNVVIDQFSPTDSKDIDYSELYYFDRSNAFAKRFSKLMEKKKELADKGEIFHDCFDDVLTILIYNDVPYLYGPSGSGKTYIIEEQISKILGLKVITNGYIDHPQEILGYNNAGNGAYVPSNFYHAFVLGNIIFFDELDNSNSKSVPVLNKFLTGKKNDTYTFPGGLTQRRHPNFRIVAAGNTTGAGRTIEYSTRQKMDESVIQRIWAVECGYQSDIEEVILKDYKAWFEFSQSFRQAIERQRVSNDTGVNSFGTFTTRDASDIVKHLDDKSLTYQQLIKYKFIQTKDHDYLGLIYKDMEDDSKNYKYEESKKLLREFKKQMDEKGYRNR